MSALELRNARHQDFDLEIEPARRVRRKRKVENFRDEAMTVIPFVSTKGDASRDAIDQLCVELSGSATQQPLKRIDMDIAHSRSVFD